MKIGHASIVSLLLFTLLAAAADDRVATIGRAKSASAYLYVNIGPRREMASAFCIHPSGIFATCKHVVEAAPGIQKFNLVFNSGDDGEKTITAHVLRISDKDDVAILKADQPGTFAALPISNSDSLVETDELTAFGFPFGQILAGEAQSNPTISVSTGRVTSLRKVKGELERIQLDASVNPGSSGGPLLDSKGQVVGIVSSGIRGAALNFAIPAGKLRRLLDKPTVSLTPVAVALEHRSDPTRFTIHVDSLLSDNPKYDVNFSLGEGAALRNFTLNRGADGTYTISAIPVEAPVGPRHFEVTVQFRNGSLTGQTPDREVVVNGVAMHLRDIRFIDEEKPAGIHLNDGRVLGGGATVLNSLEVDFGDSHATIDVIHSTRIEFKSLDSFSPTVPYRIVVRDGATVVAELSGTIELGNGGSGSPTAASTEDPGPKRAHLAEDRSIVRLPGELDDIEPAGGGRYLLLHLPKLHKLAVFDTTAAAITRYMPVSADNMLYAAGMSKLIILLPEQNIIQRFDLGTGARELSLELPGGITPTAMAMGYASNGPLCLFGPTWTFMDVQNLKPLELTREGGGGAFDSGIMNIRAAADGSAFAAWTSAVSPSGIRFFTVEGKRFIYRYEHNSASPLIPGYDGSLLFTSMGVLTPAEIQLVPGQGERRRFGLALPTYNPAYFVGVTQNNAFPLPAPEPARLTLYSSADQRSLLTLNNIELPAGPGGDFNAAKMTAEKRLHVLPDQGVIVTVPASNDQLVVHRFDLVKLLDDANIDYLFTESHQPRSLPRGGTLSYQILVRSKRGNVTFHLDSGPEGMKVSPTGLVTWHCSDGMSDKNVSAIISIKDASEQEIYHNLSLAIE